MHSPTLPTPIGASQPPTILLVDVNINPRDVQAIVDFVYPPESHNFLIQKVGGIVETAGISVNRGEITPESSSIPHGELYNGSESNPPVHAIDVGANHQVLGADQCSGDEYTDANIRRKKRRERSRISAAQDHAKIELARQLEWDLTDEYQRKVEEKLESKIWKLSNSKGSEAAIEAESSVVEQYINDKLDPAQKAEAREQIDDMTGVILDEPDWKDKKGSRSWFPSVYVRNMKRTRPHGDWVNKLVSKVSARFKASSDKQAKQVEEPKMEDPVRK
jgi:hypothetical protein